MTRAIVMNEVGGADKMQLEDWTVPPPTAGEIRIVQEAIGLNFVDVLIREGHYDIPTPFVLGQEAAGVVKEVGPGVTEFRPGDRVAYMGATGAFSEERNLPADSAFPIPPDLDFDSAASITLKGMTVYYLFHARIRRNHPSSRSRRWCRADRGSVGQAHRCHSHRHGEFGREGRSRP